MAENKPWWTSRTVWTGIVGTGFAAAGLMGVLPADLTQEQVLQAILGVVGVLAVVFRIKASASIGNDQQG